MQKSKRTFVLRRWMRYNIISRIKERIDFIMDLDNNAHSVFLLYYHLIMVVKYRRKVIDDEIANRAKEIFEYIAPKYGNILEYGKNFGRTHSGARVFVF